MSFFSHPALVLFLKRQSLDVFDRKGQKQHLDFPLEVVGNEEIKDLSRFETLLLEFFKQAGVKKNNGLLVLAEEILFQKQLTPPVENEADLLQTFLDQVPFPNEALKYKIYRDKSKTLFVAVNKNLHEAVRNVLKKTNSSATAIIPVSLLTTITNKNDLQSSEVLSIFKTKNLKQLDLETSDRLKQSKVIPSVKSPMVFKLKSKSVVLLLFCVVLVSILLLFYFLTKKNIFAPTQKVSPVSTATPPTAKIEAIPQASGSARIADRKLVKVKVLNGTDIPGQAGLVKNKLLDLGYADIETGNASASGHLETELVFSANLSESLEKEIENLLGDNYKKIYKSSVSASNTTVVRITTGEPKKR